MQSIGLSSITKSLGVAAKNMRLRLITILAVFAVIALFTGTPAAA
jgi:hypothetical protein